MREKHQQSQEWLAIYCCRRRIHKLAFGGLPRRVWQWLADLVIRVIDRIAPCSVHPFDVTIRIDVVRGRSGADCIESSLITKCPRPPPN